MLWGSGGGRARCKLGAMTGGQCVSLVVWEQVLHSIKGAFTIPLSSASIPSSRMCCLRAGRLELTSWPLRESCMRRSMTDEGALDRFDTPWRPFDDEFGSWRGEAKRCELETMIVSRRCVSFRAQFHEVSPPLRLRPVENGSKVLI